MINAPINAMPAMPAPMPPVEQQKQFNAVAITLHNPTVEAGTQNASPYNYPQSPVYSYPQGSVYQPAAQEIQQPEQYQVPAPVIAEETQPKPAEQNA